MKKNLTNVICLIPAKLWPGLKGIFCFIAFAMLQFSASAQSDPNDKIITGKIISAQGEP